MKLPRYRYSPDDLVWVVLSILIGACFGVAMFTCEARAQIGGEIYSERSSSRPHGKYMVGWNATGSTIYDGTLVMADTTGATSQPQVAVGKGFKAWTHSTTWGETDRVLGILVGNVDGYAQGKILVLGFHPWAKVDATGIAAFSRLRPSLVTTTNGALASAATTDSTNSNKPVIGLFQRYANVDSLRAYVWINTTGVMGGAK